MLWSSGFELYSRWVPLILYFAVSDLFGFVGISYRRFSTNLCPVYYSPIEDLCTFWEAMIFHRAITFFSFALLNVSPFSSSPLVGENCPKVSEMKENFT